MHAIHPPLEQKMRIGFPHLKGYDGWHSCENACLEDAAGTDNSMFPYICYCDLHFTSSWVLLHISIILGLGYTATNAM